MTWQAGDYATVEDFRLEINTPRTTDDALIESIIRQASREIDIFCGRRFYGAVETRYFDAMRQVNDDNELLLDFDLAGVSSIELGDGDTLDTTEYVMLPANDLPKVTIKILASSSKWWNFDVDPENAIAVTGTWGYVAGSTPPEPIKRACLMLSRWRYAQRKAPFETAGQGDLNAVSVPSGMPENVKQLLLAYRKPYMRAVEL